MIFGASQSPRRVPRWPSEYLASGSDNHQAEAPTSQRSVLDESRTMHLRQCMVWLKCQTHRWNDVNSLENAYIYC